MNLERKVGGIPEGEIIKLYAGDYLNKFKQIWSPVRSPNPKYRSFNQIRLELRKNDQLIHLAYSKTGNCVMIVKKELNGVGGYTTGRTLIPIEDPGGIEKAKKVIEEFLASDGSNS